MQTRSNAQLWIALLLVVGVLAALFGPWYGADEGTVWSENPTGRWLILAGAVASLAAVAVATRERNTALVLASVGALMGLASFASVGMFVLPGEIAALVWITLALRPVRTRAPAPYGDPTLLVSHAMEDEKDSAP